MNDNWIVILNANTPDEMVYRVNDTPFSVVQGWARQEQTEKGLDPIIISQKALEMPERLITSIDVSYHAQ